MHAAEVLDEVIALLETAREQVQMTTERARDLYARAAILPESERAEAIERGKQEITRAINEPWLDALGLMQQIDSIELERDGRVPKLMQDIWNLSHETSQADGRALQMSVPDAFANGRALMSSSLALQGVLASLRSAQARKGWQEGDGKMPDFEFARNQGIALVMMRPFDDTPPSQAVAAQLWEHVAKLSDLDGDVFLAMMAQALRSNDDHAEAATWISASSILDYRGVKPIMKREGKALYRAGHRTEDVQQIAACVGRLRRMRVELRSVEVREPAKGKRGKPKVIRTSHEGYLLTVDEVIMQGELGGDRHPIGWRFRLGRSITEFLSEPNRQVATLVQQVLTYDPYRERFEKRMGLYFTIHQRIAASSRAPLRRRIGGLFDELVLASDQRNPTRTRERFEAAMDRLAKDGVIPAWSYTAESQARIANLPSRGWLVDWMTCVVEVSTPRVALTATAADA